MLKNQKHTIAAPLRIISLVPSQTELLHYLGLETEVVGITKFCVHPTSWYKNKTRVGGTKNVDINKIKLLNPNLIIANKEENVKEQIEELQQNFNTLVTDVNSLQDAYEMIKEVGFLTDSLNKSEALINIIKEGFKELDTKQISPKPKSVCYLIWENPFMTVGGDTFINSIIKEAGWVNIFENKFRYPETTMEEIIQLNPDYIFLSSEPYPFKEKHKNEILSNNPMLTSEIILVDGEMFSWYGSRLLSTPGYLSQLKQKMEQNYTK